MNKWWNYLNAIFRFFGVLMRKWDILDDFKTLWSYLLTANSFSGSVKMASKVLMTTLHPAHVTTFWDRSSASAATPFIKEFTYVKKTLIYLSVPNDFSQLRVPSVVCTTTREMIVKRPKRYILISPTVYDWLYRLLSIENYLEWRQRYDQDEVLLSR